MKTTNSALGNLLQKPRLALPRAWNRLVTGEALYKALKDALRANNIGDALAIFESEWGSYVNYNPDEKARWEKAHRLIWCATQAAAQVQNLSEGLELDAVVSAISATINVTDPWQRICTYTILEEILGQRPIHSVRVPIAGWNDDDKNGSCGFMAHLLLELLPGTGLIAHHPADAFNTKVDERFETSMWAAWDAAKATAQTEGVNAQRYDGRWRILQEDQAAAEATGSSASGGGAVGWYHAITNRVYDDRVVVLAQIGGNGQLERVSGIAAKTRAIIETQYLDTIIVSDAESQQEVFRVQSENNSRDDVRLLLADKLAAANEIRSRLCEDLIDYCDSLVETLDQMDWRGPQRTFVKVSDIAVPVRVRIASRGIDSALPGDAAGDLDDPDESDASASEREPVSPVLLDPYQSELYEEGDLSGNKGEAWNDLWPQSAEMVVIRAGPGGGKTLHTRQVVVKAARDLKNRLKLRKENLEQIDRIPLWLTFTRVADDELPEETTSAILAALERGFPERIRVTPPVRNYLREMLPDKAWLIFDGLDELHTDEQLASVTKRFRAMRDWSSPCCVTCRTNYYETETLGREKIVEYELAPFRWNGARPQENEIRSFVLKWFRSDHEKAEELLRVLERNFALRHQCRTPLLLTLTCLSHQEGTVTAHTTYTDLFRNVLNGLLRRKWRDLPIPPEVEFAAFGALTQEDSRVGFMQDLLPSMAYLLIRDAVGVSNDTGRGRNRFVDREVLKAMAAAPEDCRPPNPRVMIDWLLFKGILVKAGYEGGRVCYSFAHRALMEYLAAQQLKTEPNYIEIIKTGITNDNPHTAAAWRFILPPLVGSLEDPSALITELIRAVEDDRYYSQPHTLQLTTLTCLLESKSALPDEELKLRAFDTVLMYVDYIQMWMKGNEWRVLKAVEVLHRICAASEKHYGRKETGGSAIWKAIDLARRHNTPIPSDVRQELVQTLNSILADSHAPAAFFWAALWGLVAIQKQDALPAVVSALDHPSAVVRALAARALAACGTDDGFEILVQKLNDSQRYARAGAVTALGRLGQEQAVPYLRPLALRQTEPLSLVREASMLALASLVTENSRSLAGLFKEGVEDEAAGVRSKAIFGLVKTKSQEVWPILVHLLREDSSQTVREQAAWALGQLRVSEEEVVRALVQGMTSSDTSIAAKCCTALLRNALDQARPQVELMLANADDSEKAHFIFGLKEAAREDYRIKELNTAHYRHAAELCIDLMLDQSVSVRAVASWALSFVMRIPELRVDESLNRSAAGQALILMGDVKPKVRAIACNLFNSLLKLRSPIFKNKEFTRDFMNKSYELLSDIDQVRVRTCAMLIEMAKIRKGPLLWNPSLSKRLLQEGLSVLATATPQVKTNAMKGFSSLISLPGIDNDEKIREEIMQWGLELLSSGSPESIGVSLGILTSLAEGRSRRSEERSIHEILDKTMEFLLGPPRDLTGPALEFLATAVTQAAWGFADKMCRSIAERSFELARVPDPQLKMSASWAVARIAEFRPAVLIEDDAFARSVQQGLTNWLSDPTHQVRAYALAAFKWRLQSPELVPDTEFLRFLANRCTQLLKDRLDTVKANALNVLAILIRHPAFRGNRPARAALAKECQGLLISTSGEVRAAAAHTLSILTELGSESEGGEISNATLKNIVELLSSSQLERKGLGLFNAVNLAYQDHSPLLQNKKISRIVADRSLRMLDGSSSSVQSSVLMVLQKILTKTDLNRDEKFTRGVVDRCLALLDEAEPPVKAAAIMLLESLVNETELVSDQDLAEQLTQRTLKLVDGESDKVKGAVYGILKVMAERNLLALVTDQKERITLVRNGLSMLDGADAGLRTSVLIVLGKILTKTTLKQNFLLNREVAKRSLLLLIETEPEEIKAAALRTLEEILSQTVLRNDSSLRGELIERALELADDHSIRVRRTSLLAVVNVLDRNLDQKVLDDDLGLKIIERALMAMEEPNLIWPACWILGNVIRIRWPGIILNDDLVKRAIDQDVKLLDSRDPFARSNAAHLLAQIISAELPALVGNEELCERLVKRTLELGGDPDPKVREKAVGVLAAMVGVKLPNFISDEASLRRAFDTGRALLRLSHLNPHVKADILVIFQILALLPDRHEDNTANRGVVSNAVHFLADPASTARLRKSACDLLGELVNRKLSILVNDRQLSNGVARTCLELLPHVADKVKESACWVLVEMSRAKIQGFIGDEQLVELARAICVDLQQHDGAEVASCANTLLVELSAGANSTLGLPPPSMPSAFPGEGGH